MNGCCPALVPHGPCGWGCGSVVGGGDVGAAVDVAATVVVTVFVFVTVTVLTFGFETSITSTVPMRTRWPVCSLMIRSPAFPAA